LHLKPQRLAVKPIVCTPKKQTPQRHLAICSAPIGGCGCRMAEALTNVNTRHTEGHNQTASGLSELN
jgi:hypothetical protein